MKGVQKARPLPDGRGAKGLKKAIEDAVQMGVDGEMVEEAKELVTVALLEVKLQRMMLPVESVVCAGEGHLKEMGKLADALQALKVEGDLGTETELFKEGDKLHSRLTTEVGLQRERAILQAKIKEREQEEMSRETRLAEAEGMKGKAKKNALKALKAEEEAVTAAMVQTKIDMLSDLRTRLQEGCEVGKANGANKDLITSIMGRGWMDDGEGDGPETGGGTMSGMGIEWLEMVLETGRAEAEDAEEHWPNGIVPAVVPLNELVKTKQEAEDKAAAKAAKKAKKNTVTPA